MSDVSQLVTTEEMLAMPEDGMDRELICGELRERPMTKRNRIHSAIVSVISALLFNWIQQQPVPRGRVYSGEVGCILQRDPDTTVGIDVAYLTREMVARQTDVTKLIEGPPLLAVEVLSPWDIQKDIDEKIEIYLKAGVALVWIVDPSFRTVRVHRPGAEPELFNANQELTAEPHLPGFRTPVAKIFE